MAHRQPLENRIASALQTLERTDLERRRSKADLESTVARLEQRFNTRQLELERVRARYYTLTDANREVETCIERLADLAADAATDAAEASATLTLQLRTEMLPVHDRFEDVTQDELDAEDAVMESDDGSDVPRIARGSNRKRH